MAPKIKILFLGANPSNTTRLALGNEVREIMQRLRAAHQGDQFEFVQEWAVRVGDLQGALLRHRPHIVHFSAHGRGAGDAYSRSASIRQREMLPDEDWTEPDVDGEILVEDDATGKARPLPASALAKLFKLVGGIRCVVLNACHSAAQADAIGEYVEAVIAMRRSIHDAAAVNFAWAFYQGLGFGQSLENAFELGKNQIELAGFGDGEVPELLVRQSRVDARPSDQTIRPSIALVSSEKRPTWRPVELGGDDEHIDPFLLRVEHVAKLRHPGARFTRKAAPPPFSGVLEINVDVGGFFRTSIVTALNQTLLEDLAERFIMDVDRPFRRKHPQLRSTLVHQGHAAPLSLRARLDHLGIELQTFDAYQGLFELQPYLDWQTRELEKSPAYLASTYVDPPASIKVAGSRELQRTENALVAISDLLLSQHRRFLLVLGEFGAGKTFLLRELCRHMVARNHPVLPVLLEMAKLEKQHSLAELLGAHFARADVSGYNFKAFEYMLSEGRVALFFDGFDELADRVTYDSATQHLETVLSATAGQAKIVLSSRRQHFLTEGDVHKAVEREFARKAESAVQGGYRLIMLEPFGEAQIQAYLRNVLVDESVAAARYRLLDDVKDLIGLSHNPRMLSFIAKIPEESLREAKAQCGEITAAKLYELLVNHWLDFEYDRALRQGSSMRMSRLALLRGVESLALSMWQSRSRVILAGEIHQRLGQSLAALNEPPLAPEILTHIFGSGSLLVRDEEGRFAFVHRSVLEWLVAKLAANELANGNDPPTLTVDEMGVLMADFFTAMAGRERVTTWAREKLANAEEVILRKNATLLLTRMGERLERVTFEGQDLRGKDFSGVDLRGANLRAADLRNALFRGADLRGASLVGANLSHASLHDANLAGADLTNADLSFVRAPNADFSNVVGFEPNRYSGANFWGARGIPDEKYDALAAAGAVPPALRRVEPMYAVGSACTSVAWSPVQSLLAVGHQDGVVSLVDATAGRIVRILAGHVGEVRCVAFSPDGKFVATGSDDRTIRLWRVGANSVQLVFAAHKAPVHCIAFAPDGLTLVSGSSDKTMMFWDVTTGKVTRIDDSHRSVILGMAFSPDGKVLACACNDNLVRVIDAASGLVIRTLSGHTAALQSVAFLPEGQWVVTGSSDNTVRLGAVESGQTMHILGSHDDEVYSVAVAPSGGIIASASQDQTIKLWGHRANASVRVLAGHISKVQGVAFAPDGATLASVSADKTIRFWDVATGRPLHVLGAPSPYVLAVAFSPDGKTVATASQDKMVRVWNMSPRQGPRTFGGHGRTVGCVAFAPNGKWIASGSSDKTIRLWDLETDRVQRTFDGHTDAVCCVAFSPDGKTLASGSFDMTVRHWDVASRSLRVLRGHTRSVNSVAFSPDGKMLASGSSDKTVRLWDLGIGRTLRTIDRHASAITSVAFSPDGKCLASALLDDSIQLWEVATGAALRTFSGHTGAISSVAFSPHGKTFATASFDNTIRLWDVATGKSLSVLKGHMSAVLSVSFSPDGKTMASGSYDNTVRLWDVASGKCYAILLATPEGWVTFTPDGRYKSGGNIAGSFWHVAGLCRFEPGELDEYLNLRLPDDAPLLPAKP